jgi:3-phenylpropionate/trans-cinnamate dioxygenase ferredoxin reductase subunit
MEPTCLIVGGGLAAATAALTLRTEGYGGRIAIICDEEHPPYSRPPLSKSVIRGEVDASRTHLRPGKTWENKDIELLLGRACIDIDVAGHRVRLADGERLGYDKLLLATGGKPRTLPGTEELPGVHVLRTIDDSVAIARRLGAGRRLIVIGAGFIGAELAASARTLGTEVTVIEAEPRPLSRSLPPALGEIYAELHRGHGVDLRLGSGVSRLVRDGEGASAIGVDGREHAGDCIVVAVGLVPDVDLARRAGLAVADRPPGGIIVDEYCRTSAPDVYAAGDVANHPNPLLARRVRIEHWQNAQHQGAAAARNMLGLNRPFAEVPWVWSDQYDTNLQIAGIPEPADRVVLRGDVGSWEFTAFLLRDGVLAACVGVNRADDVRLARKLIGRGVRPDPDLLAYHGYDLTALDPGAEAAGIPLLFF